MQQEGVQPNLLLLKLDFENKVSSFHHVQETSGMVGKVKKLQHTASEIRNHNVLLNSFLSVTMKASLPCPRFAIQNNWTLKPKKKKFNKITECK
jgi:hypothetical protein